MASTLTYVDLFAGCGGLSLGLEASGFQLALAVEKSDMAAETYYHNFVGRLRSDDWQEYLALPVQAQFEQRLIVRELEVLLHRPRLLRRVKAMEVDLVAGGPPCQGFSMAGRRNPGDKRNQLPWQFLDFVEAVSPKAVIIENVVGIGQDFHKAKASAPFNDLRKALERTGDGYLVQPMRLNAIHFGVPQHRPRMLLVGVRRDIVELAGIAGDAIELWRSEENANRPPLAPESRPEMIRTVREALWDLDNKGYTVPPTSLAYRKLSGAFAARMRLDFMFAPPASPEAPVAKVPANHHLRMHRAETERRFKLYQYLAAHGLPLKVVSSANDDEVREFVNSCRDRLVIPARSADGDIIAKSMNHLEALIRSCRTRKHSQRPLKWDAPAPTMLSLPDDFVHPTESRAMTVREMARLQSFPDRFEFRSRETTGSLRRRFEVPQYTQVGNAVPPLVAMALGTHLRGLLS